MLSNIRRLGQGMVMLIPLVLPVSIHAARVDPPPLLESLKQGFGVVGVKVIEAQPAQQPYLFGVRCRVELLVAQPVTGHELPIKPDDEIIVPLSVCYSGHIEPWGRDFTIEPGTKYFLIVSYDPETTAYTQVRGASSVRTVESFDDTSIHRLRSIRLLAAADEASKFDVARNVLVDPLADLEVRISARRILRGVTASSVVPGQREPTIALLRRQWSAASMTQGLPTVQDGYGDLCDLDETLQAIDPSFTAASAERVEGWFQVIFSPFEPAEPDDVKASVIMSHRWGFHIQKLIRLETEVPGRVAPRVIREMKDPKWPLQFRVGLAGALQHIYQQAALLNVEWEAELHAFYPAAFNAADPWVLRLLPSALKHGATEPEFHIKRKFIPDQPTRDAMKAALVRMHTAATASPRVPNAVSAEKVLREAIQIIEEAN